MKPFTGQRKAFSLVEVTIALGVAGFCLLAVFGLLPIGLTTTSMSIEQTAAANLATEIMADLRGTPSTSGTSSRLGVILASSSNEAYTTLFFAEDGCKVGATGSSACYRADVKATFPAPGQKEAVPVSIRVTWPANAVARPSGCFEVLTTLDRN